jgi:hypothetical protein
MTLTRAMCSETPFVLSFIVWSFNSSRRAIMHHWNTQVSHSVCNNWRTLCLQPRRHWQVTALLVFLFLVYFGLFWLIFSHIVLLNQSKSAGF